MRYLSHYKTTLEDMLTLPIADIENMLIDYLLDLRKKDLSSSYINLNFCALKLYYFMNDVRINKEKIGKYLGEQKRKNTDRAYSTAEIRSILDLCDTRMKVVVSVLCSTGMRIGAITPLQLKHLEKKEKEGVYKFTIYEKTKDESICFNSPESAAYVDSYLDYRCRAGERLTPESFFIREMFDVNDIEQVRKHGRGVATDTISNILHSLVMKAGLRKINHNFTGRERKPVPLNHGYRKWWMNQAVTVAKMQPEIREMLLNHRIGIASAYYRPSESELLAEYMGAIENGAFVLSEEKKLKRKVEMLTIEKSKVDQALFDIQDMKARLGLT